MRPRSLFSSAALVCAALWFAPAVLAAGAPLDTARIEQLTGLKGTLNQKAVVDGDFAMLESEVQGVLKVLRGAWCLRCQSEPRGGPRAP